MSSAARTRSDPAASPWRHLPNAITLVRMVLVVPLVCAVSRRNFGAALIIVALAGATDALDGFLAKQYDWRSWLGGVLDPLADKLLLVACFVSLYLAGAVPGWLMWLVVGRDLVIVAGALAYHSLIGRVLPQPSILSKITTCVQIAYVLVLLVHLSPWIDLSAPAIELAAWLTALATVASGLDYVFAWSRKALQAREERM